VQTDTEAARGPAHALWEEAARQLKDRLSDRTFSAWFGRAHPLGYDEHTFSLGLPTPFARDWVTRRYGDVLQDVMRRAADHDLELNLVAAPSSEDGHSEDAEPDPPLALQTHGSNGVPRPAHPTAAFHPKYSFDSFVIGPSNRFAHAAALAAAEAPAQAYNPLFIYGGAGLGKTHLLHALGRYVLACHPHLSVRYISTEQFTNEFISAVQRRHISEFHSRYRATDLLLVDDIQFLEGKDGTQEEFFHTFNALHPASQIVITSDRPPKKISTLEERLRSRFAWGLITDIQPPDLETRLAILRRKSETETLAVPTEVMSFIASRIQTNIRELEGALIRIAAYASLTRSHITLALTQDVLESLLPDTLEARVTPDLAISITAEYFDVTPDDLRSPSRSRSLVNARQMAMYLVRELTDLSLPKIGERFGGRDHSTVIHATNKIREQLHANQSCYEQVQELTTRIRQRATRG
jgi:chromosomal replication initiator protein